MRLLDFLLNDWKDRAAIDPASIGFFGFSLGGATGLVLMGTKPDFARVASLCKETTGVCAQLHNGETPPEPIRDARIRAAVIVDPAPAALTRLVLCPPGNCLWVSVLPASRADARGRLEAPFSPFGFAGRRRD